MRQLSLIKAQRDIHKYSMRSISLLGLSADMGTALTICMHNYRHVVFLLSLLRSASNPNKCFSASSYYHRVSALQHFQKKMNPQEYCLPKKEKVKKKDLILHEQFLELSKF